MALSDSLPQVAPADLRVRLSGTLVTVEPLAPEHLDGLDAIATDAEMFRWIGVDISERAALEQWLRTALANAQTGIEVPFTVRSASTGEIAGTTRFLGLQLDHLVAEIGWTWYSRAVWGSGVNAETKLLLLRHAFETVGLRRVEFKTDSRNQRSRGALTKLGAQYEGTFRKHRVLPGGEIRDSAYYSVIDDEWPAVRAGLQQRLNGAV
ncbi:MAG TPA: GNAT family protein [Solirubrobacteraceae bacterium]|jgi:RimJ/RimL family protein N-acetyltransferase